MARPGPRPLPDNVLAMRGRPGKRPPRPEVKPPPLGSTKPPEWLSPQGKRAWRSWAAHLERHGLLTVLDVMPLCFAAESYSLGMAALDAMRPDKRKGYEVIAVDERGLPRRHPAAMLYRQASAMFLAWAREFGLTPSARVGLDPSGGLVPVDDDDDVEDDDLFS